MLDKLGYDIQLIYVKKKSGGDVLSLRKQQNYAIFRSQGFHGLYSLLRMK